MQTPTPPYTCKFCGNPSWHDPSDQWAPADYCHEADHGEPPEKEGENAREWHTWFAWYPVYTIEVGWQWLVPLHRKKIPQNWVQRSPRNLMHKISEKLTGAWHRIPD